jgi:hypothetical protein
VCRKFPVGKTDKKIWDDIVDFNHCEFGLALLAVRKGTSLNGDGETNGNRTFSQISDENGLKML